MSTPGNSPASGRTNLLLFLISMALLGMAGGMFETTFNNYLHDGFDLAADARGLLEFPRELPGFLTALFTGVLFFLAETRIAAACGILVGIGMLGLAAYGQGWYAMLGFLTLWSVGTHLIMPVRSSLSMELASKEERGKRLGQIQGAAIAASIVGCLLVWGIMKVRPAGYGIVFSVGGGAAIAAGLVLLFMRMPGAHLDRPKFVWDRRYWLYYVLSFLFGARKQIFITFGPWVLVKIFHQQAVIFAQLWIIASVLGILVQPLLGRVIDRLGERVVLIAEAVCVLGVCLGYGFAHRLPGASAALILVCTCFVLDQLLFGVNMARDMYLAKIAVCKEHVAPTLSLGVSINHAVSMTIPAVGGWLWMRAGHAAVFQVAAGFALVMLGFSLLVPRKMG